MPQRNDSITADSHNYESLMQLATIRLSTTDDDGNGQPKPTWRLIPTVLTVRPKVTLTALLLR